MRETDDIPEALHEGFFLENIGGHMERHYHNLYTKEDDKEQIKIEDIYDNEQDYLSYVNFFSGHNPNY